MSSDNGEVVAENKEQFYAQVAEQIAQKALLRGKTRNQRAYLETINTSILVLCTGPAGCGKTYIPVVRSIELLKAGTYKKILVARPAVPCGRDLGYLPGDENEKMTPYMRPIKDVILTQLDMDAYKRAIADETIELCSLAYMRGRTLNNTFMILDEAQNATWEEILMFMTRIGENSKVVISGDEDQRDTIENDFRRAYDRWSKPPYVDGAQVVRLYEEDIIRNEFIIKIVEKMRDSIWQR